MQMQFQFHPWWVGGGAHDHLGIVMNQVEYAAISASPWVEPYNPNAITTIPPCTNVVDAAQIARMHAEFRRIYTNRINVDQALNKLILEAYDNMYTSQLEDYLLQYANRSALEILMHLKQTYGFINPTHLDKNYNKMTAPTVKLLPLPHPPRARPHGRTDKPKRPESHPTKECARARVRCL
jgi:hypothetical protein